MCLITRGSELYQVPLNKAVLAWQNRRYRPLFIIWNLVSNVNMFLFYGIGGTEITNREFLGLDLALPLAVLNVLFFGTFLLRLVRTQTGSLIKPPPPVDGPKGVEYGVSQN